VRATARRLQRLEQRRAAAQPDIEPDDDSFWTDGTPNGRRLRLALRQLCHGDTESPELDARYGPLGPAPPERSEEEHACRQTLPRELHQQLLRLTKLGPDGRPRHEGASA
jgi:hypothetical protein